MPESGSPVGYDLIGDQIIPINILGKEYIAVKGYGNNNDERVYMEAIQDNTVIWLDGNVTPFATINTGENYSIISQTIHFISNLQSRSSHIISQDSPMKPEAQYSRRIPAPDHARSDFTEQLPAPSQ